MRLGTLTLVTDDGGDMLSHSVVEVRQTVVNPLPSSEFEKHRPRLVAIATRILGSTAEADDVVQDAWFRVAGVVDIDEPAAWLTTTVTRLCLDRLRRQRTRSDYESEAAPQITPVEPEAEILAAEQVAGAMQVVLDTLAPAERAAFVLHDVFGYPFDEISVVLGRSPVAVRQLATRARRKVRGLPESPADRVARASSRRVVEAFLAAARGGELTTLLSLLAPDAVMHVDSVGRRMGVPDGFNGAHAVAARFDGAQGAAPVTIDGEMGGAWIVRGTTKVAFAFHVEDGLVREIELIADPDVLATFEIAPAEGS
jgi:RNA polymerase sigma-70 factor (ECF subfamily)